MRLALLTLAGLAIACDGPTPAGVDASNAAQTDSGFPADQDTGHLEDVGKVDSAEDMDADLATAPDLPSDQDAAPPPRATLETRPSFVTLRENGAPATVEIRLDRAISDPLTVTFANEDLEIDDLTIPAGDVDWHTVELRAVDNDIAEPVETFGLVFDTMPFIQQRAPLTVQIDDDEVAGLEVSRSAAVVWSWQAAEFSVYLQARPTEDVIVHLYSEEDPLPWQPDGTWVVPNAMVFTPQNWDVPQYGGMGVDSSFPYHDEARRSLSWRVETTDPAYGTLDTGHAPQVSGTFIDDDFFLSEIAGVWPSSTFAFEGGPPTEILLRSHCFGAPLRFQAAAANPDRLRLTPSIVEDACAGGGSVAADRTVTALEVVDDSVAQGHHWELVAVHAVHLASSYGSIGYNPLPSLRVLVVDDDEPEIVSVMEHFEINERLAPRACTQVVLSRAPTTTITVNVESDDTSEVVPSVSSIDFGPGDWSSPRRVCAIAVDDDLPDGPQQTQIVLRAAPQTTGDWAGVQLALPVRVTDDETPGLTVFTRHPNLAWGWESRWESPIWIFTNTPAMDAKPVASATPLGAVHLHSIPDLGEWWAPHVRFERGEITTNTVITVSGSAPTYFQQAFSFEVLTLAPYQPLVVVDPLYSNVNIGSEVNVWLSRAPIADVTIPVTSAAPAALAVTPSTLTFDSSNWSIPQTLYLQSLVAGTSQNIRTSAVLLGPAQSDDPTYDGVMPFAISAADLY